MEFVRKVIRRRQTRRLNRDVDTLFRSVAADGFSPVALMEAAVREECGFPRRRRESLNEYIARAGGVSVADIERLSAAVNSGERLDGPEFAAVSAIFERIGQRLGDANG